MKKYERPIIVLKRFEFTNIMFFSCDCEPFDEDWLKDVKGGDYIK